MTWPPRYCCRQAALTVIHASRLAGCNLVGWHSGERVDLKRWRALRMLQFDAADWRCVKCSRGGHLELDHVTPLHVDPAQDFYSVSGTQVLCKTCHRAKSRGERTRPNPERDALMALFESML